MKRLASFFLFVVVAVGCQKATVTLTAEERLTYDVNRIDEFLQEKGITNAVKMENGMRYVMHTTGTGPTPTKDNCFTISYTGIILYEDEAFDSSTSYTSPLKQQVAGMQIMLKLMPVGSKATVYIPSALAYGTAGRLPTIPGNSILVFDLELFAIHPYHALGNYCY